VSGVIGVECVKATEDARHLVVH